MHPDRRRPPFAESLDTLFWTHLSDLYTSEQEVVQTLERLSRAVAGCELQQMLIGYRKEAQEQVERLERVFVRSRPNGSNGTSEFGSGAVRCKRTIDSDTLDVGLIIGVRFLAEYKIAAYRAAQRWAGLLGYEHLVEILQLSLEEEECACRDLIVLAEALENCRAEEPSD